MTADEDRSSRSALNGCPDPCETIVEVFLGAVSELLIAHLGMRVSFPDKEPTRGPRPLPRPPQPLDVSRRGMDQDGAGVAVDGQQVAGPDPAE